jgi:hypothetical protein
MGARGLLSLLAAALLLFGCNVVVPPSGTVATLQLNAAPPAMTAGDFFQLRYTARDNAGSAVTGRTPTFSSSNPNVIRITTTGVLMAVGPGTATVTARLDRGTAQTPLTVAARSIPDGQVLFFFGPEETVFTFATQRCEPPDVPDNQARAVRLADGSILLLAANDPHMHMMRGPDFDHLTRDCRNSLVTTHHPTPQSYHNREWLWSLYRVGGVIHALVHNEYHDPVAAGCKPGDDSAGNPCWYNSATYARSTDNGVTFAPPSGAFTVAPAPIRWDPTNPAARTQPHGYFNPSNIVKASDGFYYALLPATPAPGAPGGTCIMRTRTLDDPSSWRAWNGSAFALAMTSPYAGPAPAACAIVITTVQMSSFTYNTYLQRYVAVGDNGFDDTGFRCGPGISLSSDLVRWSTPHLLFVRSHPFFLGVEGCTDIQPPPTDSLGASAYATFLDHTSQSINFETAGQTPYFYNTAYVSADGVMRNLVRRPVIILKSPSFNGDLSGPVMFLETPGNNATVFGSSFLVSGWAFDDVALSRVEILVDGVHVGDATLGFSRPDIAAGIAGAPGNSGFKYLLNTLAFANGRHTITARAIDTSGNASARTSSVTVSNTGDVSGPRMNLEVPANGSTIFGSNWMIIGWAFDDFSLSRVEIAIDGVVVGNATLGISRPDVAAALPDAGPNAGFRYILNTFGLTNGAHTIVARAIDASGNATAQSVSVTVSN